MVVSDRPQAVPNERQALPTPRRNPVLHALDLVRETLPPLHPGGRPVIGAVAGAALLVRAVRGRGALGGLVTTAAVAALTVRQAAQPAARPGVQGRFAAGRIAAGPRCSRVAPLRSWTRLPGLPVDAKGRGRRPPRQRPRPVTARPLPSDKRLVCEVGSDTRTVGGLPPGRVMDHWPMRLITDGARSTPMFQVPTPDRAMDGTR